MVSSSVFFILLSGCLASVLGDVDILKIEKAMSAEVEVEFSGKEAQDELEMLRQEYDLAHPGNETFIDIPTEIDINSNLTELFEGDIILTPKQWKVALDYDPENPARRRQGLSSFTDLWEPLGAPIIPYTFDVGFPAKNKQTVLDAIKFWEDRTCAKFRPSTRGDMDTLLFSTKDNGCYSYVGRVGGQNLINLSPNGCNTVTIAAHELSHTFGTLHVQSRSDRDKYVTIDTANIKKGVEHNFKMEPYGMSTYDIPYEFGSMQHYFQHAFAINRQKPTIYARPDYKKYQGSMDGPRATFWDTVLINKMYKCTDKCPKPIACKNNGVQHGNDCNKCFCPRGWAGTLCERRPPGSRTINVVAKPTSIHMEMKGAFKGFEEKLFILQAPAGKRIQAIVNSFGPKSFSFCRSIGLEVIPWTDTRTSGFRFCAPPKATEKILKSNGNTMLLWLYRDVNESVITKLTIRAI